MNGRVLVAGFATRHVAQSACRAGWKVCAVDHFCDADLDWYTEDRARFEELEELPDAIAAMCSRHRFDLLVVTSGAEDLQGEVPVCGPSRETVGRFLDKLATQRFFTDLRVPVPGLVPEGVYPAFFKPRRGAGGWRNAVVRSEAERRCWEEEYPEVPYIRQEVADGISASGCCVTDGKNARAVAANEQMLRDDDKAAFGFSGSITPCAHPLAGAMIRMAEKIAAATGCRGTIGIDFLLGDGITVIEVNPRFQATVDTVEAATGCSVFSLHEAACRGILSGKTPAPQRFSARKILFADRDIVIRQDLSGLSPMVADIPRPGTALEEGQAVVSVYGSGSSREDAARALDKNITTVRQYLR